MLKWLGLNKKKRHDPVVVQPALSHYKDDKVGNDASARPWERCDEDFVPPAPTQPQHSANRQSANLPFKPPDVPSRPCSGLLHAGDSARQAKTPHDSDL